jgi:hypothetical protein
LLLAVATMVALAGCVSTPKVWFTTPIGWGSGYTELQGQSPTTTGNPIELQLVDDTHAELTDFPQGISSKDEDGYFCLDVSTTRRYTGPATWSNRNGFSLRLTFADSSIVVSSIAARFRAQDWTGLQFDECGHGDMWALSLTCGVPGYGGPGTTDSIIGPGCNEPSGRPSSGPSIRGPGR